VETLLAALLGILLSAVFGAISDRLPGRWRRLAPAGLVVSSLLGLLPVLKTLLQGEISAFRLPWGVPGGSFSLLLDPLSAFFLLFVLGLSSLAATYAVEYLEAGRTGFFWFFFGVLTVSMSMVTLARNAVLFLVAWEIMTLASFFLVTFEDEHLPVRRAGWFYLAASHVGTAFLLLLFVLLGRGTPVLDFDLFSFPAAETLEAGVLFALALVGFGVKAGFVPLHIWLPEAHPAAPSPVSALMSGVLIKMGIYGLVRVLGFWSVPSVAWGKILILVGLSSGILGVLFALAQHDLKRLLAYHSVENIGIIALGLGLGVLGKSLNQPLLAVWGMGGGLLHVANHAMFKSVLFLGAGAVARTTGTRDMDRLGGLLRKMPWTGGCFLVGAAAITGIPPLNGFVSEFLIFCGAFHGLKAGGLPALFSYSVVMGLGLIGGLAAACFAKAFGAVFLGEPRNGAEHAAREAGPLMRWPMGILAAVCVLVGLFPGVVVEALSPLLRQVSGLSPADFSPIKETMTGTLEVVSRIAFVFLAGVLGLWGFAAWRARRGAVAKSVTWDCGFAAPSPRMQYSASSFAQPFTDFFRGVLRTRFPPTVLRDLFPTESALHTKTPDVFHEELYRPLFGRLKETLLHGRRLQHGRLQLYVLYIVATLVALLVWSRG